MREESPWDSVDDSGVMLVAGADARLDFASPKNRVRFRKLDFVSIRLLADDDSRGGVGGRAGSVGNVDSVSIGAGSTMAAAASSRAGRELDALHREAILICETCSIREEDLKLLMDVEEGVVVAEVV